MDFCTICRNGNMNVPLANIANAKLQLALPIFISLQSLREVLKFRHALSAGSSAKLIPLANLDEPDDRKREKSENEGPTG